jgi:hypothetical protein
MTFELGVPNLVAKGVNEAIGEIIVVELSRPVVLRILEEVIGVEGEKICPYFMKASKWDNIC